MLMRAALLADPPSDTRMLTPLHPGAPVRKSPVRSAVPATDDKEVLSKHAGLDVHTLDDDLLDRDIEMEMEEPTGPPVPPSRPVSVRRHSVP